MLYWYNETSKSVLRDPFGNIDPMDFGKPFERENEIDSYDDDDDDNDAAHTSDLH